MRALLAALTATVLAPLALTGLLLGALSADGPTTPTPTAPAGAAQPFTGPDAYVDDPTTSGRITRRTLHAIRQIEAAFGSWSWSISCWDAHAWNPTSDHPRGRACDYTVGHLGRFPTAPDRTTGWRLAHWLRTNAPALGITYIIWDGHIWSATRASQGWRPYTGAGIYNPESPTGGHFDHLHISIDQR